jgi:flavin-dependent dehydrogenase
MLVRRAAQCGTDVRQPARCVGVTQSDEGFVCRIASGTGRSASDEDLSARVVLAAHGSWDVEPLNTQRQTAAPAATDWVAFKAHFRETGLPPELMPLLSFPDGYGGMVHCDDGRTTLSCCIRRERLMRIRRNSGESAGEAVHKYILDSCPAARAVLVDARREGSWLAAGPIQPGIRPRFRDGIFSIGNAAGEAHPVVAEGISMAMQSAWLLARLLILVRPTMNPLHLRARLTEVACDYSRAWYHSFAPRIRAAAAIAQWASRPAITRATLPVVHAFPGLLTFGARLSGKSTHVVPPSLFKLHI